MHCNALPDHLSDRPSCCQSPFSSHLKIKIQVKLVWLLVAVVSQLERFYHKLSHSPRVVVAVVVGVVAWHRSYSRVVPFSSANCVSLWPLLLIKEPCQSGLRWRRWLWLFVAMNATAKKVLRDKQQFLQIVLLCIASCILPHRALTSCIGSHWEVGGGWDK